MWETMAKYKKLCRKLNGKNVVDHEKIQETHGKTNGNI